MTSREAALLDDVKNWPNGLNKVYKVCDRIVYGMILDGCDGNMAQKIVIDFLKEYEFELRNGRYTTIVNALVEKFD